MSDWYALVDGAQDPGLYPLLRRSQHHHCLFAGKLDPVLEPVSPYLVLLDEREPLLPTWRDHGAGRNWGMLVESNLGMDALRRHFRRFLQVRLPAGEIVLFRFFDPRVFATYITSAPPEQAEGWFRGVTQYMVEAGGVTHSYRWRHGRLFDFDRPVEAVA